MKSKISRFLTTLVALIAMTAGAWATDANTVVWNNTTWSGWTESQTTHTVGDITITATGSAKAYQATSSGEPLALQAGANDAITFTSNGAPFASVAIQTDDGLNVAGWTYNSSTWSYEWSGEPTTSVTLSGCDIKADQISFTFGTAATAGTALTPDATRKVWTLDAMPAGNVVLHVEYEPEFTATFKAANALTIEAGKATVSVTENGQPVTTATLADGKLSPLYQGQTVILTASEGYKFRKVEAKEGEAGRPAAEATADDKGKLIGADGNIYDDAAAATAAGTTAVAKIIYLGSETGDATYTHGLALALADEGEMTWATAVSTCSGKNTSAAVPDASWMLPSQAQWNKMISAAGSYTALRDSFSSVGGTNMSSYYYWSSTEIGSDNVYYIYFGNGNWGGGNKGYSDVRTRAVLAF